MHILMYSVGTKATRLKAAVHYTLHTPYLAEILKILCLDHSLFAFQLY